MQESTNPKILLYAVMQVTVISVLSILSYPEPKPPLLTTCFSTGTELGGPSRMMGCEARREASSDGKNLSIYKWWWSFLAPKQYISAVAYFYLYLCNLSIITILSGYPQYRWTMALSCRKEPPPSVLGRSKPIWNYVLLRKCLCRYAFCGLRKSFCGAHTFHYISHLLPLL